jgi:hypothetical protein
LAILLSGYYLNYAIKIDMAVKYTSFSVLWHKNNVEERFALGKIPEDVKKNPPLI